MVQAIDLHESLSSMKPRHAVSCCPIPLVPLIRVQEALQRSVAGLEREVPRSDTDCGPSGSMEPRRDLLGPEQRR